MNQRALELEAQLEEAKRHIEWLTQLVLTLVRPGSHVVLPLADIRATTEAVRGLGVQRGDGFVVLEAQLRQRTKAEAEQAQKPFRKLIQ